VSFAKATLSGILTSEPEKRFTPNNHAVTSFNISVENPAIGTKTVASEPFLVKVTCWRNLAEAVTVLQKGDCVLVDGKLIMNSYQTPEGVQKKLFELEANNIDKLPGVPEPIVGTATEGQSSGGYDASSRNTQPAYNSSGQSAPSAPAAGAASGHFSSEDLLTEDDIPF
jgi:single-strand DNA-binding protein